MNPSHIPHWLVVHSSVQVLHMQWEQSKYNSGSLLQHSLPLATHTNSRGPSTHIPIDRWQEIILVFVNIRV